MTGTWWAQLRRRRLAMAALGYLVLIVAATSLAGVLAPYDPEHQDLTRPLAGPSAQHLLGTGELGKDVLSRLLYGGRVTLLGVLVSVTVFAVVGITLGLVAGYLGGWVDRLVVLWADTVYSVPVAVILLVVLAIFPGQETVAMVALGLLGSPGLARVVRATTMGLRGQLYVRAAKVAGLRDLTIMRRHVLPQLVGPIVVQVSLFGAAAVGLETALGYLRIGVPGASWGSLVAEASLYVGVAPWLLVPSGLTIITFILALGLLGDGVRDATAALHSAVAAVPGPVSGAALARPAAVPPPGRPTGEPLGLPTGEPDALLTVRGLTVEIPGPLGAVPVVSDVSFTLDRGDALGVVGESGCGKTVTATAVLGLVPGGGRICAGSVRLAGVELVGDDPRALARLRGDRIGWVSQDPVAGLDPSFTVGAQLGEVIRIHRPRSSRRQVRDRVRELLALVRLPDPDAVARAYPHQLSGGMAQRVGIAAAVAGDPELIIADEPTTALDVTVQVEILDLLRGMRAAGVAIVLVTHDWGVLADLCDRAVVMYAGEVVESGPVDELVRDPQHPYTAALLRSSPHLTAPGEQFPVIAGAVPAPGQWPQGCRFRSRCPVADEDCALAPVQLDAGPGRAVRCLHPATAAARR